jgi:hypothetical protein
MTDKLLEFMEYMEKEILPRQKNLPMDMLQHAGNLIGVSINIGCRSCAEKGGEDILRKYEDLLPEYAIHLAQSIRYVEEVIHEDLIKEIVQTDELPVLNDFRDVNKTETYHRLDNERKTVHTGKKLKTRK